MNLIEEFTETMRRFRYREVNCLASINADFERINNTVAMRKLNFVPKKLTKVKSAAKAIVAVSQKFPEQFQFPDIKKLVDEQFHGKFSVTAVRAAFVRMTKLGNFHSVRHGLYEINGVPLNEGN